MEQNVPKTARLLKEQNDSVAKLPNLVRTDSDLSTTPETSSEAGTLDGDRTREGSYASTCNEKHKQHSNNDETTATNFSKRARTLLTAEQSRVLHEVLQQTSFPSTQMREAVAAKLGLSPRKVQVFFQNKRQKQRKKTPATVVTSHPLAAPVYKVGGPQPKVDETDLPVDRSGTMTSSVDVAKNYHRYPMAMTQKPARPLRASHSPDHWTGFRTQQTIPTHRRVPSAPYRYSFGEHRQPSSAFEPSAYGPKRFSSPQQTVVPPRLPIQPVSSESNQRSTVLPPIIPPNEHHKSSRPQLPGIDELISKAQ
ncbi:hypothetical protein MYAM1_002313 [Malassezia yamatoensis]|uniref:Homeobox domain-containing protein n=1 Tax=Malassezia yamatoensis TaxID=253288 RepID=A0AAJ6CI78_9BASI|nr:hypothetical protein MYAM1_002313 [Malassezia yamatoensis]